MKTSFVLYTAYIEQFRLLTDEQAGNLIKAIFAYEAGEETPAMDGATEMAFSFIKSHLDADAEKYEATCEKRRAVGKLGGRPSKADGSVKNQNNQMVFLESKKSKRAPDNDIDIDIESESENDLESDFDNDFENDPESDFESDPEIDVEKESVLTDKKEKRQAPGLPKRIYAKIPIEQDLQTERKLSFKGTENNPSEGQKTVPVTERNLSTSNKENSNNKETKRGSNAPPAYGSYQNVFLTEEEYRDLQKTIRDCDQYIERLFTYMVSTGRTYQNHAATIKRWADRDNNCSTSKRSYEYREGESL